MLDSGEERMEEMTKNEKVVEELAMVILCDVHSYNWLAMITDCSQFQVSHMARSYNCDNFWNFLRSNDLIGDDNNHLCRFFRYLDSADLHFYCILFHLNG